MTASHREPVDLDRLAFYISREHACSYLPEHTAMTLFADPEAQLRNDLYAELVDLGFRRSGRHVYRPNCPGCNACRSVRIPVAEYALRRADRRALKRNADLAVRITDPCFNEEQFDLYRRYLRSRHPGGDMDNPKAQDYLAFLTSPWSDTRFVEFRAGERLVAVAVVDLLPQGLSAVYTFFEPGAAERSLGHYVILWQIEETRRRGLPWLYLGYWIEASPKMRYKSRYRPFEQYHDGLWQRLERE